MPITAVSADKVEHEFPDGTEQAVIDRVMKEYAMTHKPAPPESRLARIGHGLMDPIYGAAQLGARMEEPTAFSTEEEHQARVGAVDTAVQERERAIQEARPIERRNKLDWLRLGGSIPTSTALAAPAMFLGGIPGAMLGGAMGAIVQPETDTENFAGKKAESAAFGAIAGGVLGGLAKGAGAIYQAVAQPETNALAQLGRAAQRDGTTIEQLQQRLRDVRQIRPNATIADVAGENVRGLVERIGQTPGAGVAKLAPRMTERQQQQLGRLAADLRSLTGTTRTAQQAIETTMASRAREATPLYQRAFAEGDREIFSPELERLAGSPAIQSAMHSAVTSWQDNAIADGFGAMNPAMVERGGIIQFHQRIPAFPNLQFWDYTKRAMDNMVSSALRAGENQRARTLTQLTQQLRGALDAPALRLNTYRAARQAWGGPSQYLDAIETGRNILSRNIGEEEMAAAFSEMAPANQEAFRIGAISAIRARMGNDPAKLADITKYLRSPEMRAKIAAMMPSRGAAERWLNSLDYEVRASELTGQALKGSPTARRLAQQADADTIVGDLVLSAITPHSSTLGFLKTVLGSLPKKVRDTLRSRSDNILIDLLTTPEGAGEIPATAPQAGGPRVRLHHGTPPAAGGGGDIEEARGRYPNPLASPLAAGAGSAFAQPTSDTLQ